MTDKHIDEIFRELQDELNAVQPSPEFAAKVRAQVAAQPVRRWFGAWQIATAAAGIAAIAMAMLAWPRGVRPGEAIRTHDVATLAPPAEIAPAIAVPPAAEPSAPRVAAHVRPQSLAAARLVVTREPEVLVPADQRNALIALLDGMRRRGNQVPSETTPEVDSEGRLPAPAEIKVSPITIEPLSPPVPGGGSRERR